MSAIHPSLDDQAALDAGYDNRAAVPDHGRWFDAWRARSAALRARRPACLDIPYGPSPRQRLDLFPPDRAPASGAPCILFFHGGYWQAMDKSSFSFLAGPFVARGMAFAAATYELCPTVTLAEIGRQSAAALRALRAIAREAGIDPERIVVAGHSAGGQIAALLAHMDWRAQGLARHPVRGALALSGLYDLEPIRRSYLNAALRLDAAMAASESPRRRVRTDAAPLVLAVGGGETGAFLAQQRDHARALAAAGAPARAALEIPGEHHFSVVDRLADVTSPLWPALLRLTEA